MRIYRTLRFLLLLPAGLAALHAQTPDHDPDNIVCKEAEAYAGQVQYRDFNNADDPSYDLTYYRFEWTVDPAVYFISGKVTPCFTAKVNGLSALEFNLSTQLTVDAVQYHGANIAFSQSGDYGLTISLPAALNDGDRDSLSILYHGVPPSGGFGSFIQSSHDNTPIIWTLSEPFGAQDWWPCKNGLTDKVDSLDVFVTTPAQYRVASNGTLEGVAGQGPDKTYHWRHRYAIAPYLVAIAVTNYAAYTDIVPLSNGTLLPMLNYVYPEHQALAQSGTADLAQVLQFFDSLFVPYPFFAEKYGHAEFGWGGGMEHQTMSFVINFDWGLLSHELAHQWFGDMVTCGSWEDIWLNEGFATFLEGLTRERFQPGDPWLNWRLGKINSVTSEPGGTVRVDDTTSVGRIFNGRLSYNKGSYLLHMLRWKLGDAAFFQGVRNYLNDRGYKFAYTPDLKTRLETAGGQSLSEFFNDWYYGEGFPSYQVYWQQIGGQLHLQLNQTTSVPASVPFFEMPVPLRVSGNGQTLILRLEHTVDGEGFNVPVGFAIDQIEFDPDLWLLSAHDTVIQTVLVGTEELRNDAWARLVPNPAHDLLRIEISNGVVAGTIHWEMMDALGRMVKRGGMNDLAEAVLVGDLVDGVYRVRLYDDRGAMQYLTFLKE